MTGHSCRLPFVAAASLLAACTPAIDVSLSVADTDGLESVRMAITAVQLIDDAGNLHTLSAAGNGPLDLRDLIDGQTLLLTDADLDTGRYTGVRLQFGEDPREILRTDGGVWPVTVDDAATFADLDIRLDDGDRASVILTLDLRFSLQPDTDAAAYTLAPVLHAVATGEAASLSGTLASGALPAAGCADETGEGAAVHLYAGQDRTPADFRVGRSGPLASTPIRVMDGLATFRFDALPAGAYTLAWTCEAAADTPVGGETLSFRDAREIDLPAGSAITLTEPLH